MLKKHSRMIAGSCNKSGLQVRVFSPLLVHFSAELESARVETRSMNEVVLRLSCSTCSL